MSDTMIKSFWPIFVNELGNADIRQCSEAYSLFLEQSRTVLSHGKVLFSNVQFTAVPNLEMLFFGPNTILITNEMEDHQPHVGGQVSLPVTSLAPISLTELAMVFDILSQATQELWNRCCFSKAVLPLISPYCA